MATFHPASPEGIACRSQRLAAQCAAIARQELANGDMKRASIYQSFSADWAAGAIFNLLLALHGDVDVAEAAFNSTEG